MNAIATIGLIPQGMDDAIRLAKAMSTIKELPKHLHDSVGTCLMVVDQALRWQMSPFAVAQESANIQGRMMYSGKLMAAAVESMGAIRGGFDYQFEGVGDDRTITVSAVRTGETEPRQMKIRLGDVKTNNEMWKKQPDQQLVYSGSRNWARRWTPAALLGAYSPEEFPPDPAKELPHNGPTLEHEAEAPKPETERDRLNASVPLNPTPPKPKAERTPAQILEAMELAIRDCGDIHAVSKIVESTYVVGLRRTWSGDDLARLEGIIAAGIAAHAPVVHPADEADIWGEERTEAERLSLVADTA
jgi:hypothetical protein